MMAKIIQDIESIQKIKVLIVNRTCTITLSVDKSLFFSLAYQKSINLTNISIASHQRKQQYSYCDNRILLTDTPLLPT